MWDQQGAPPPQYGAMPPAMAYGTPPPPVAYGADAYLQAPPVQQMSAGVDLTRLPGVVVRQVSQWGEVWLQAAGVPWESANKYSVSALPPGKRAAKDPNEPGRWKPTSNELESLPVLMKVEEESSACTRMVLTAVGGLNMRGLRLHYMDQGGERFTATRDCVMGGCCGCPSDLSLFQGNQLMGKALEDFDPYCSKCYQCCCLCTFFTSVMAPTPDNKLAAKYTIRNSMACCGRVNNCCGATCCKNDAVLDVLDSQGKLVATIQKTYAPNESGSGCEACCRCTAYFDNYIMEYPPDASAADRALLLNALLQVDYLQFEATGGDDNDSSSS